MAIIKTNLSLNVYTDETLQKIRETKTVDSLKIPYRAAMLIIGSLKGTDLKNEEDLFNMFINCADELDPVIKATFGLTDNDLLCIDIVELIDVGRELYKWGIDKVNSLTKGEANQKNA